MPAMTPQTLSLTKPRRFNSLYSKTTWVDTTIITYIKYEIKAPCPHQVCIPDDLSKLIARDAAAVQRMDWGFFWHHHEDGVVLSSCMISQTLYDRSYRNINNRELLSSCIDGNILSHSKQR